VSAPATRGAATQIFSRRFDARFFALPADAQIRLQAGIDRMSRRLAAFPHFRMQGAETFRLRVGDYRVIYQFNLAQNEVYLLALGHRRDIYKH
jgi:mRNA-degrading endonuclease RelE of RelBE toxin-antitoxin system